MGCNLLILVQESAFPGFVTILGTIVTFINTLDSVGNIVLQKSDCSTEFSDTVEISD